LVGGKLDVKTVPGTEEDIEADLIVSAIGQAVDFTGLEVLNNGKGAISQRQELPGAGPAPACSVAATWSARTC
jgi:NADPH-dependent glutamate synthase beta subunit-like oxidoreductase